MAVVALTDTEKSTLLGSQEFKSIIQQKVLSKVGYFLGLTTFGDTVLARSYVLSRQIENTPQILLEDNYLNFLIVTKMAVRGFLNKDDTASGLVNQVVAYLNAESRFDYLVDDYFAERIIY